MFNEQWLMSFYLGDEVFCTQLMVKWFNCFDI